MSKKAIKKLATATALKKGTSERARKTTELTGTVKTRILSAREKRRRLTKLITVQGNGTNYVITWTDNMDNIKKYTNSNIIPVVKVQITNLEGLQKRYVRNHVREQLVITIYVSEQIAADVKGIRKITINIKIKNYAYLLLTDFADPS